MRAADGGHVACVGGIRAVLGEFEVSLRVSLRVMLGGCKRCGFISWFGGWLSRGVLVHDMVRGDICEILGEPWNLVEELVHKSLHQCVCGEGSQ